MKRVILLSAIVMAFATRSALANTYTVTTNADAGAGSLRDAIQSANTHTTSTDTADMIVFNISGSDAGSRTINLKSVLPVLERPVIIDGSTQPNGDVFGVSGAKIKIVDDTTLRFTCFTILTTNTEIYGLYITGFEDGILVQAVQANVQIGSIPNGNLINNIQDAAIKVQQSDHVQITGNLIGTDSVGKDGSNYGLPFTTFGIVVSTSSQVAIGDKGAHSGNTISHCSTGVWLDKDDYIRLTNNSIGSSIDGFVPVFDIDGIVATGKNSFIEVGGDSTNEGNIISGNSEDGIQGWFLNSDFKGNHIGVDGTGFNGMGNGRYGIYLKNGSINNQIGDSTLNGMNIIAYNGSEGVILQNSTCLYNSIRVNTMICNSVQNPNGVGGIALNRGNDSINAPKILISNSQGMTGMTVPGGTVDFYKDDGDCAHCEGRSYLGSSTDSSGIFFLAGNYLSSRVTATVTDPLGNTSEFSNCSTRGDSGTCISTVLSGPSSAVCAGSSVNFYDQSVILPGTTIIKRVWNFGDGTTSSASAPVHIYTLGDSTYTVTLFDSTSAGCVSGDTLSVSVSNSPQAKFSAASFACSNTPVNFADSSSGGQGDVITSYSWNFGDGFGDTTTSPTHAFADTGTFAVTLTVTNSHGCSSSFSQSIAISQGPEANFTVSVDSCTATITNISTTSNHVAYTWTFGDGTSSSDPNPAPHLYHAAGIYKINLSIYDTACNITAVFFIPVHIVATTCATGITEVKNSKDVKIIPNPAGSSFYIQNNLQQPIQSVQMYDVIGKLVFEIPASNIQPNNSFRVDLPLLSNGIYTLRLKTPTSFVNEQVIENR